jgi:ABC-type branched-subunit amino acid transport system permease subunit
MKIKLFIVAAGIIAAVAGVAYAANNKTAPSESPAS